MSKEKPAVNAVSVTPSDSTDLDPPARALYIGGTGDIKVDTINGDTATFTAHPVGYMPVEVKRVHSTGTTASSILALR